MRVIEIQTSRQEQRYVVIDDEGNLIEPIVAYLKYLDRMGAARHTLRSYATMLRLYWEFLLSLEDGNGLYQYEGQDHDLLTSSRTPLQIVPPSLEPGLIRR